MSNDKPINNDRPVKLVCGCVVVFADGDINRGQLNVGCVKHKELSAFDQLRVVNSVALQLSLKNIGKAI